MGGKEVEEQLIELNGWATVLKQNRRMLWAYDWDISPDVHTVYNAHTVISSLLSSEQCLSCYC